ncbi:MAG: hypothetical protein ABIQ88_22205 [Chitinophagaceae bacterium]
MKKQMPFDFLLDYLPANVVIRPAIGMYYIYWEKKIVLIFRKVSKNARHNGLWIATNKEQHASLKAELPAITNFVFDEGATVDSAWLQLKDDHDDFETTAIRICELISHRDKRIGKETPKAAELTR